MDRGVIVACAGSGDVASSSSMGISVSRLSLVIYMQKKMKKKYLGLRRVASRAPPCCCCWWLACISLRCLRWLSLTCIGLCWPTLACVGHRGPALAVRGHCWSSLACVGVCCPRCWSSLACVGYRGPVLAVCWPFLVFVGLCWLLVLHSLVQSILISRRKQK